MDRSEGRLVYEFDAYHLDAGQRLLRLRANGQALPLSSRAFETLLYFVEHSGELLDKARLMKALWPNTVVEENNLTQNIATLRRVLGESPEDHRFIVTVPGRGYRFVAGVRILPPSSEQPPEANGLKADLPPPTAPLPTVETPPEARDAKSSGTNVPWGFAIAALGLLVGSLVWLSARPTSDSKSASVPFSTSSSVPSQRIGKLRVAILPFENLSPDPAHAFFADGLHEEILTTIAQRAPSLEVISRTTMMSYRGKSQMRLAEVARELGASHVIEGSVRREAQNVRLTLQLIDARTDAHVWSQNYDRTLTDSLTLQSDVAGEVASQLSVQLASGARSGGPPTQSPVAYDLYLKALLAGRSLNAFAPVEQYRAVEELFSGAIAVDPSFAFAYARRAAVRILALAFNYDVSDEQVHRIREDLDAARRLNPRAPLVLATEASYWMWVERDLPRALTTYESAEEAGLADPWFLSGKTPVLVHSRRTDEAVRFNERVMELDPGNPFVLSVSAVTLSIANRAAEALRVVDRGLEHLPRDATLRLVRAEIIFAFTGRADEWRAALDRAGETTSLPTLLDQHFALLRVEHRYAELQTLLDGISPAAIRVISGPTGGSFFGVGPRPTAEYRGWTALLLKDSATAAAHGRVVLEFVAHRKETKTNAWFLQLLTAEGLTFLGQRKRAITAAREALELMPPSRDAQSWVSAAQAAAGIYAWSGAHDEAVTLLEELFTARAGFGGPAPIARDPLYAVPLAQNPRYQALARRVEAQMQATTLR